MALPTTPPVERVVEVLNLYRKHFRSIPPDDYILQSEVLRSVATLTLCQLSTNASEAALEDAVYFLNDALVRLPGPERANHASIYRDLGQCYARMHGRLEDMEQAFLEAVQIYDRLKAFDDAAMITAMAADVYHFYGKYQHAKDYLTSSKRYLLVAGKTKRAEQARSLIQKLKGDT